MAWLELITKDWRRRRAVINRPYSNGLQILVGEGNELLERAARNVFSRGDGPSGASFHARDGGDNLETTSFHTSSHGKWVGTMLRKGCDGGNEYDLTSRHSRDGGNNHE
jgi:hypothetical protein